MCKAVCSLRQINWDNRKPFYFCKTIYLNVFLVVLSFSKNLKDSLPKDNSMPTSVQAQLVSYYTMVCMKDII